MTPLLFLIPVTVLGTPEEGVQLRQFFADVLKISGDSPAAQPKEYRDLFAHNPQVLTWIGRGNVKELLTEAGMEKITPEKPPLDKTPALNQLLGDIKGSLGLDYTALTGELKTSVGSYYKDVEKKFVTASVPERLTMLHQFGDDRFHRLAEVTNNMVNAAEISKSGSMQQMGEVVQGADISPKIAQMLTGYYDRQPLAVKRQIIIELLRLPPDAPEEKQLAVLLHNSGPIVQKLFQLIGGESPSPEVRQVMKELFSDIPAFPGDLAKAKVEEQLGKPIDQIFSEFKTKPLKAATVGQVHAATLKNGEEVVVKVLRPEIVKRAMEELKVLREVAGDDPFAQGILDNAEESMFSEVDLRLEGGNIVKGRGYKDAKLGLDIADLAGNFPVTQEVMVIQRAKGTTLAEADRSTVESLMEHGRAVSNFIAKWFKRAIFMDGFFHADGHPGNMFFQPLPGEKPPYKLTMIDFGSTDQLNLEQRRAIMKLAIASWAESPEQTVDALSDMTDIPDDRKGDLTEKYREFYRKGIPPGDRVKAIVLFAGENGFNVDREILQFNRGKSFLERALASINAGLDERDPLKKVPRFDANTIYAKVIMKEVGLDVGKQVAHKGGKVVTLGMLKDPEDEPFMPIKQWSQLFSQNRKKILTAIIPGKCLDFWARLTMKKKPENSSGL